MFQIIVSFLVCIIATTAGSITGVGGGVIIKPILDAVGGMPSVQVNFLSGCTVLAMSVVSVARSRGKVPNVSGRILMLLALGGAFGGVTGKYAFDYVRSMFENQDMIKVIQNALLGLIILGIFVYLKNQSKIRTLDIKSSIVAIIIGVLLGVSGAFLGIGGGPINLVVLYYFFSMTPKMAAYCSVFIIMLSQSGSLIVSVAGGAPEFDIATMIAMVIGGVAGGFIGSHLDKYIDDDKTQKLFSVVMIAIVVLSGYNIASVLWF